MDICQVGCNARTLPGREIAPASRSRRKKTGRIFRTAAAVRSRLGDELARSSGDQRKPKVGFSAGPLIGEKFILDIRAFLTNCTFPFMPFQTEKITKRSVGDNT